MRLLACMGALLALTACAANTASSPSPPASPSQASGSSNQSSQDKPAPSRSFSYTKGAPSGATQRIGTYMELNPDCTSRGYPTIRVLVPPANGRITSEQGQDYAAYEKDNDRYACNKQKAPTTFVYYTSNPGYVGTDTATIYIIYSTGNLWSTEYKILVQ